MRWEGWRPSFRCDTQTIRLPPLSLDIKWANSIASFRGSNRPRYVAVPNSTAHHQTQCILMSLPSKRASLAFGRLLFPGGEAPQPCGACIGMACCGGICRPRPWRGDFFIMVQADIPTDEREGSWSSSTASNVGRVLISPNPHGWEDLSLATAVSAAEWRPRRTISQDCCLS